MVEVVPLAPYTQRMGLRAPFMLSDNFSDRQGAKEVLLEWVDKAIESIQGEEPFKAFLLSTNVESYERTSYAPGNIDYRLTFQTWVNKSELNLLDGVDFLLHSIPGFTHYYLIEDFNLIMASANLNYQCNPQGPRKLMHRVLPAVQQQYLNAVESVPEVTSKLLSTAWEEAYGHKGNPELAWTNSRKAVENILKPIVHPKNNNSTITRLISDIEAKPSKFSCSIPLKPGDATSPVIKFVELLKMMPYEEVHHGGNITLETVESTCDNARTQVLLAATICQIVADGDFRLNG